MKNFTLAAKFSLEIAGSLKSLGKFGDAQLFYERAASMQQEVKADTTVTALTAPATVNLCVLALCDHRRYAIILLNISYGGNDIIETTLACSCPEIGIC